MSSLPGLSAEERRRLDALLRQHEPADVPEEKDLTLIRSFVERQDNPFDRGIREAHLTASSFILDPGRRLLLTFHRRLDLWLQLGGHAETEREAGQVALREAREESGLDKLWFHSALLDAEGRERLLHVDVHSIPAHGHEAEHLHLDLRFLMETDTPELIQVAARESKGLDWLSLSEAQGRCDESVGRAIQRIRPLLGEASDA